MGKIDEIPTTNYKMPEVPEYLKKMPDRITDSLSGKKIFISGGSGFLGKVLIEKLLRKVTDLDTIYLLLRPKKGKEPRQRLDDLFSNPLFDSLKSICGPQIVNKVTVIPGDVSELGLGISEEDRKTLIDNAQIVFHSAASVRFDEPLKKAVLLNTRGTRQMLELASEMKKLELFVHISTAYCHLTEKILLEKPYPAAADPHNIIKCCELLDEDVVEGIGKKLMKNFPNSYSFTKNLSEGLVNEKIDKGLPAIIIRPSIVIPMWLEPLPGWTDNINGPTGLLIGAGKGVIRTMYCDNQGYADYVPVDITVNGILVAAWNVLANKDPRRVFHITSSAELQVTWQEIIDIGRDIVSHEIPLNNCVWYPGGSMKRSKLIHQICVILFHMIPAYFLDSLIFLSGNKPVLLRVQDRINKGFDVFEYYANNQWDFANDSLLYMRGLMNSREAVEYKVDGIGMDIRKYFSDCILAARLYILKETPDQIPGARRHMRRMFWLDMFTRTLVFFLLIWLVYNWFGSFIYFIQSIFRLAVHIAAFFKTEPTIGAVRHEL